jgi:hypothetical protein
MDIILKVLISIIVLVVIGGIAVIFLVVTVKDDSYKNLPETWTDDEDNEYLL